MLYTVEQDPTEENIIKQCLRENKPFPKRIQNAPELAFGLYLYWQAFWDLDTCRAYGQPVPWFEVQRWIHAYNLDPEQAESLEFIIRTMDNAYLKHLEAAAKKKERMATTPKLKPPGARFK